jgi:error-prone DNA polymerase
MRTLGTQSLNEPAPISVQLNADGMPKAVVDGRKRHAVRAVVDRWFAEDKWWRTDDQRRRIYAQLLLDNERVLTVFCDLDDQTWWRQQVVTPIHQDIEPVLDAGEASDYVELHLHSNYSLLEGASHIEEIVELAKSLGYKQITLTDHDNLYGAMTWATTCKRHGLRPITGLELTYAIDPELSQRFHITLLAENRQGYSNICRLAGLAHGHMSQSRAAEERRRRDPCISLDTLSQHCQGLICLTGCRQSELSTHIDNSDLSAAGKTLERWTSWFGRDNVYVELVDNIVRGDRPRNRRLASLARQHSVKCVATGNVHYHDRSRQHLQDALVSIAHRTSLDEGRRHHRPNGLFHLRSPAQQASRFAEWPDAVRASAEIAQRCTFDLNDDLGYELPSPPVPSGETTDTHLEKLCTEAIASKYQQDEQAGARQRLEIELGLIARHNLAGFFLVYNEVLKLAEKVAQELRNGAPRANSDLPPGRGRGSSAGSIVCYLIGLSHIDPIRNNLFIGRFLNEDMVGFPDIDLDFPRDIRARLFERVYEKWGKDHAAIVGLFPTYRIRSAIRDVGKALGLPPRALDRLAKFSEGYGSATHIKEEMERLPQFAGLVDSPGWRDLIDLSVDLAGFPRHFSQHVGGVIISSKPLVDSVPIEPAAWPGRYVCHWDKDAIDDARMVKIDFLGLGMLSLVEDCIDLVATQKGDLVDLSRINFADERVFDRICKADTIGVFQIESRAQAAMLPRTLPRTLDDLTAQVAIIRPGPIVGGALQGYVKGREFVRNNPGVPIALPHELLRPILEETYGVVLYQEQVVQVARDLGGFTAGEAETFRRAMSRHDWHLHEAGYRAKFMAGATTRGVAPEAREKIYQALIGFASFGFPKSHSVAFGLLAYQSTWLKEYYPAEFYCALYNQWPMGFYPPHVITNDAKRHGIPILRPDINLSQALCTVEDNSVRIGLTYVDGVGNQLGIHIAEQRNSSSAYHSLFDYVQRSRATREATENLITAGAFDDFGLNHRELLWQLGLFGDNKQLSLKSRRPAQMILELPTEQDAIHLSDFSEWEKMANEYGHISLSPSRHPLQLLRNSLQSSVHTAKSLMGRPVGSWVDIAGLVVCRQHPMTAKGTVFLAMEDETGLTNVTIAPKLYEAQRTLIRTQPILGARARLEGFAGDVPMLRAHTVYAIETPVMARPATKSWS